MTHFVTFADATTGRETIHARNNASRVMIRAKLQALVYDVLHPTTAMTGCAIGLRKLSANGQFVVGAVMAVSW